MLISKLLRAKKLFTKKNGDVIVDLISSTFDFSKGGGNAGGYTIVSQFESMRPDLVCKRIYDNQNYYELLLKYNGISNPFSLEEGEFLLTPQYKNLDAMLVPSKNISEKGKSAVVSNESKLLKPKTVKDKKRLEVLKSKTNEIVPPNVNTSGNKNVKIRNGKVIFGEDVTQINKDNCPIPISRARLIQQLTKANLF